MNKVFANADEAIYDIKDDQTIMLGGFGLCGIPEAGRRRGTEAARIEEAAS